jgi:hypothetical protein
VTGSRDASLGPLDTGFRLPTSADISFTSVSRRLEPHLASSVTDAWGFPQFYGGRGVILINLLHLMPRLRMRGARSPSFSYVLIVCCLIKDREELASFLYKYFCVYKNGDTKSVEFVDVCENRISSRGFCTSVSSFNITVIYM